MAIKLDILGQSQIMGLPDDEATALMDAIDGVSDIDRSILMYAGIVTSDKESFQHGSDLKRQVEPSITTDRLLALLDPGSGQLQAISTQVEDTFAERKDIANALRTRALVLLIELADAETLKPILRKYINSQDPEQFAAAAAGLSQLGLVDEVLGGLRAGTDEMRVAFLQSLKWGAGSSYRDVTARLDFGMTSSRIPSSPTFDRYLQELALNASPDLRAGAIEVLTQRIEQVGNFQFLRDRLLTESDGTVLTALLWNRSAYLLAQDTSANAKLMELSETQPPTRVSLSAITRLAGSMDPNVVQFIASQLEKASSNKERMSWLSALWFNGQVLPVRVASALRTLLANCNDSDIRTKAERLLSKIGS